MQRDLCVFREVGIKLSKQYGLPVKIVSKGNRCLFLGYESNHPWDTYRVLDLKIKTVMLTRDVRWLGKTYGDYLILNYPKTIQDINLESSDDKI